MLFMGILIPCALMCAPTISLMGLKCLRTQINIAQILVKP